MRQSLAAPLSIALAAALPGGALAADPPSPLQPTGNWAVAGAGISAVPQYEGSDDYEALPVPAAVGEVGGIGFALLGPSLTVDLVSRPVSGRWHVTLGPTVAYNANRSHLSVISDTRIRALGRVKPAVELGGDLGLTGNGVITSAYDQLSVSFAYRHDVNGAHRGDVFAPSITYLMPVSPKTAFLFQAEADHADSRYAQAYFGITPAQSVASGLPAFSAGGGWKDWTLGAAVDVSLTGNLIHGLSAVGGVSYTHLLNDFGASPVASVAGSRHQWMVGAGLAYAF